MSNSGARIKNQAPAEIQRLTNQGIAYHQSGKLSEARAVYSQVLERVRHFDALHLLGLIEYQEGNVERAIELYQEAIAINPHFSPVYGNLGLAYAALNRLDEAMQAYQTSIEVDDKYALGYNNLGSLYWQLNRHEEALEVLDKAIKCNPNLAQAYNNRSNVYKDGCEFKKAEADLQKALKLNKNFPEAMWNLAFLQLIQGDFANGWKTYEIRWQTPNPPDTRQYNRPKWDGKQSLNKKTIFIYDEQGLGDTLMFCRYVNCLTQLGAKVILETHGPLKSLMHGQFANCLVIARGEAVPNFDYHQALMSMPFLLGMDSEGKIPFPYAYLRPHRHKVDEWQAKLGEKSKPRIGILWAGRATKVNFLNRSLTLEQFASALPQDKFEYVCLQPELNLEDQATAHKLGIRTFLGQIQDLSDTAAICYHVDMVVSVDTGPMHLAAALGKPTWGLVPFNCDWRWMTQRQDSPWYDSLTLFRQSQKSVWEDVLLRIRTGLEEQPI